ncbi:MAG: hypothetical protein J2P57_03915 [Acidimicrobiaceae bacterium]|nr:hypothetical protein [Acidimicrobiaceae bacterium]
MARDDSQPGDPPAHSRAGPLILRWELTLPGISDRFWRAQAPNLIRWLMTRHEDGRWYVSRYPQSAPNPESKGVRDTFDEAKQLAEDLAREEGVERS